MYIQEYETPHGFDNIILLSDGECLTGLYFENGRDISPLSGCEQNTDCRAFVETRRWLDIYFSGNNPDFTPFYKIAGLTPFGGRVTELMNAIPYGATVTYNDIAKQIAAERGIDKMSAQAVGGAVGRNPICIIVPCHRVMGANGKLTGYGGGIKNKLKLLELEKNDIKKFTFPK